MRPRVSLAIITLNEARAIERCIGSCRGLVDEVVVVDSGSSDGTQAIAARLGARVVHRDFDSFGPQKNHAVDLCTGEWVLNLDADEWLCEGLRAEIRSALDAAPPDCAGWAFPRHNLICGRWPRFGGWRERSKFRLWRRGSVRWAGSVHEWGEVSGSLRVGRLREPLLHDMGDSWRHYLDTQRSYADRQAVQMHANGRRAGPLAPAAHAAWAWFRSAVLQLGVLEGHFGLRTAAARASYAWRKWAQLRRLGARRASRPAAAGTALAVLASTSGGDAPRPPGLVRQGGAVQVVRSCAFTEGPRNLLQDSRGFPSAPWRAIGEGLGKAPDVERRGATAPDGEDGAVTVRFNLGNAASAGDASVLEAELPVLPGQGYTFAFSVRAPAGTVLYCRGVSGKGYSRITCDGGWQRVSVTETAGGGRTASVRLGLVFGPNEPTAAGRGASFDLWGPHVEQGRSAPRYLPTGSGHGRIDAVRALHPMRFLAPDEPRIPCQAATPGQGADAPAPAATNLLRWTMDLGRRPWLREGISAVIPSTMASPVGLPAADGIVEDGSHGPHGVRQAFDCGSAGDLAASVFLRAGSRKRCLVELSVPGSATAAEIDLADGHATRVVGEGEVACEAIGRGWFRAQVTARAASGGAGQFRVLTLAAPGGPVDHAGDGKSGIAAWGAQVEAGNRATAYVPTFFVPETRSAEAESAASR